VSAPSKGASALVKGYSAPVKGASALPKGTSAPLKGVLFEVKSILLIETCLPADINRGIYTENRESWNFRTGFWKENRFGGWELTKLKLSLIPSLEGVNAN